MTTGGAGTTGSAAEDVACRELVALVTDYLEGALDADRAAAVAEHLATCEGCQTYVEQMRRTIRALGEVPVETMSPDARAALLAAFRDLRG